MFRKNKMTVSIVFTCLTISQFALAQNPRVIDPNAELTLDDPAPAPLQAPVMSTTRQAPRTYRASTAEAQSIINVTPSEDQLMVNIELDGISSNVSSSGISSNGLLTVSKNNTSGLYEDGKIEYGLTRNFYIGAHLVGEIATGKHTGTGPDSNGFIAANNRDLERTGLQEPGLLAGAQIVPLTNLRIFGDVEGTLGMGNSQAKISTDKESDNYLQGGTSIIPRVGMTYVARKVTLTGSVSYQYLNDRTSETIYNNNSFINSTQVTSGGNITTVMAALEIPAKLTWGFAATYQKSEQEKDTNQNTLATSQFTLPDAYKATAYLGIPLTASMTIVPRLDYITLANNSISAVDQNGLKSTTNLDSYQRWDLGILAQMNF